MFRLPAELSLAGPVATQADLHVPLRVDVAVADKPKHRRPVRQLDVEHLCGGIRMRVEMDQSNGTESRCDCLYVGFGDRVVAAEDDRDRAGGDDLADSCSIAACVRAGSAGSTGASPKSTTRSSSFQSTFASRVARRTPGGRIARGAEARSGPVRDEVVGRSADDRDVETGELERILCVRHPRKTSAARRSRACPGGRAHASARAGRSPHGSYVPGCRRDQPSRLKRSSSPPTRAAALATGRLCS